MTHNLSRRVFTRNLGAVASAALLSALQSSCKSLPGAQDTESLLRDAASRFNDRLSFDADIRARAADDFGHIIHRQPVAVLNAGSPDDVVKAVELANEHGFKLAMNGNNHSCYGHAQAEHGLVINSAGLKTIRRVTDDSVDVDAGITWGELTRAMLKDGRTFPVLAEFQDLSVGGTLSVGGIGGSSHRFGAQVDHVIEVEAVTGTGQRLICSADRNRDLFETILSGFGQCALILRARLRLVRAPRWVTIQSFVYRDASAYTRDALGAMRDERFDHQLGRIAFDDKGVAYRLEGGRFHDDDAKSDLLGLAKGLRFDAALPPRSYGYWDYLNQRPGVQRPAKGWYAPHPNFYVFIPIAESERYLMQILASRDEYAGVAGPAQFGFYPVAARHFTRPLFARPAGTEFFALYMFRGAPADAPALAISMVKTNRTLYERARAVGGICFPVTAMPMSTTDWRQHFGEPAWQRLAAAKKKYDPRHVLTPGPGIFA